MTFRPSAPRSTSAVLSITSGAGVGGPDGDHEPHPVDHRDHPPAPQPGQPDLRLGLDERGVRRGEALRAQVVLVDVGEPVAAQRVGAAQHGPQPHVQRVRGQQGRDRDVQVTQPGGGPGHGGEGGRELRVGRHQLQDQFGQVNVGQHRRGPLP
jgi:hypothetical protein